MSNYICRTTQKKWGISFVVIAFSVINGPLKAENTLPVPAISPSIWEVPIDYYRDEITGDVWRTQPAWRLPLPSNGTLPSEMWQYGLRSIYLAKYACMDSDVRQWMPTNIVNGIYYCTNPENRQQTIQNLRTLADKMEAELNDSTPTSYRYTDNGNGTVTDNRSGLIWLKNANCFGELEWGMTIQSVANLASGQCGLSDGSTSGMWRLPTKNEWEVMIDKNYNNPALSNAAGTAQWMEGDAFSGVPNGEYFYWSSTNSNMPHAPSNYVWYVVINDGSIYPDGRLGVMDYSGVWPVR
ncbi:MAG: hypothetical protein DRQ49_18825 [Gammaproteobacteria bacterium]|nr:MAG: hypothetical protein DRQ49_18825 [Gammaproteobacteria bacterium]RKZ35894.1 MAG: hypothetical protein DRQ41_15280 [Gammaproteobacteria bacterium]